MVKKESGNAISAPRVFIEDPDDLYSKPKFANITRMTNNLKIIVMFFSFSFFFELVAAQNECFLKYTADSLLSKGLCEKAIQNYQLLNKIHERKDNYYRISICYCCLNQLDSAGYYFHQAIAKEFYYSPPNTLENDINLKCLKEHPDYKEFSRMSDTINFDKSVKIKDRRLYEELLRRRNLDQYVRSSHFEDSLKKQGVSNIGIVIQKTDSLNMLFLDSILSVYNYWPGFNLVGIDGDNAAWLIAQHADKFTSFQEKCYEYLIEAIRNLNTNPNNIAYLYDRIMINTGKKQKYGTQMRIIDGKVEFINLEDFENVDKYRNCFNLPSITIYKDALEKQYLKKQQ